MNQKEFLCEKFLGILGTCVGCMSVHLSMGDFMYKSIQAKTHLAVF